MANSTYNIILRNGGDIKQKYNLVFYNAQQTSGGFTIHEQPSYRSIYITDAKIDESGHLILLFSDQSASDVGYVIGPKGAPFVYEDFTPEQLAALKGAKGDAFTYEDFTEEQLKALTGPKGDAFTYDDFTEDQLAALKGAQGETGRGFAILGYFPTVDALTSGIHAPQSGDAYGVGKTEPYDIYIWDGTTSSWVNNGRMQGAAGKNGTTFTPAVSQDGVLSWTNDGGLANPDEVSIKGAVEWGFF